MAKSLGVFVTNPDNFHHVMGVVKAAKDKGSQVKVFFTWTATHNAKHKDFPALCELADHVSICVDSYRKQGYDIEDVPEGLTSKELATQAQHGIIIEDFDSYISF
jgi:hypothetical protein